MDRLQLKTASISKIREAFGTPSVSCGVLHHGEIVFLHSNGYADTENKSLANPDTVYSIASCSKGFVSALCNILVHEGKLSWTAPVSAYIPSFQTVHDPEVGKRATLLDLCSHGTGLAPIDHVCCGFFDQYYNKGTDQIHISAHLPVCYDFRSRWLYNNFMLGVAGEVIAAICKKSAGSVLKEKIFDPLGMNRSCTHAHGYPADGNVATGYSVLDDGSLLPHSDPELEDGGVQGASGFVRSSVNDMLTWAKSLMIVESRPADSLKPDSGSYEAYNILRNVEVTRCARRPIIFDEGLKENSYGLGWFRHSLPSKWLGSIGPNFALLQDPPVIGEFSESRLTICHYGEFGGFLTSFYTFPDTCSAVIVMANSSPSRGDPTDLIAQMLIQEIFEMQPKVKIEEYALRAAHTAKLIWPALVHDWVSSRVQSTATPPLQDFSGIYTNNDFLLRVEVFELSAEERGSGPSPELLGFRVNSIKRQTAKLRHYHYDVWTFLPNSRDDLVRKGMEGYMVLPMLLLSFIRNTSGAIYALDWDLQAGVCEGPAPEIGQAVAPVRFMRLWE
ncbi:beta-lactamase/transpeptidase-like protein [Zopfia rhizophila CBS 207.26]|uniref:Beta-lactamase/transpeptidase-like protein n=1 Tax=Zopfia rhizophila CBS 207.26 TaxID=1314779 RepID=A0A6A6EY16_9PEZI|nr:beta-lactamase/transpeptidase-like protein [Zopfia rhizophila CBS 207.26]